MFLQIIELKSARAVSMNPHSHDYYELYFQFEGKNRKLFIKGNLYDLPSTVLCVFPPFCVHQLDGESYRRININISKDLLSDEEQKFLDDCSERIALILEADFLSFLESLLMECVKLYNTNNIHAKYYSLPIVKTILYFLQTHEFRAINHSLSLAEFNDPIITKVIVFLNENYQKHIDIKMLCNHFFLSKATLSLRFKKMMNCSIMEYLLQLRLSKARDLLFATNQSIELISENCGFSSTNYFRSIFKKIIGIQPLQYRKQMRGEEKKTFNKSL